MCHANRVAILNGKNGEDAWSIKVIYCMDMDDVVYAMSVSNDSHKDSRNSRFLFSLCIRNLL